jgi:hypothetical protein
MLQFEIQLLIFAGLQHEEELQSLYNRISACAKQTWELGGLMLQDFAEYFSMHYFLF